MMNSPETQFAICIRNEDYPASLEVRKIYEVVADPGATKHRLVRIIDESGEDYLYPQDYFVPIALPQGAEHAFMKAS